MFVSKKQMMEYSFPRIEAERWQENVKDRLMSLLGDINKINETLYETSSDEYTYINTDGTLTTPKVTYSLIDQVKNLQNENVKLKAVVAELCDYVYGKGQK